MLNIICDVVHDVIDNMFTSDDLFHLALVIAVKGGHTEQHFD